MTDGWPIEIRIMIYRTTPFSMTLDDSWVLTQISTTFNIFNVANAVLYVNNSEFM